MIFAVAISKVVMMLPSNYCYYSTRGLPAVLSLSRCGNKIETPGSFVLYMKHETLIISSKVDQGSNIYIIKINLTCALVNKNFSNNNITKNLNLDYDLKKKNIFKRLKLYSNNLFFIFFFLFLDFIHFRTEYRILYSMSFFISPVRYCSFQSCILYT